MNGGDIKIDNPDGLFNFVDIFRSKPKPVEIEIDNTKTQQHIISIPDNSVTTTNNPSNNGVKFERKSPDFCKFEFGTSNQNIFEICPEDELKFFEFQSKLFNYTSSLHKNYLDEV